MVYVDHLQSFALFLNPVFLAGGGGVHPGIAKTVNLALFLGVLYFLLRKPTREFFANRFAAVRATLQHAAREKEAAMAKMAELEARLNRLDDELGNIKSQTEQEAAAELTRIEAETEQEIERIKSTAKREIESAKQIAISELREFAATKAVDLAEQMIRHEIKPDDDAKLLSRMVDTIGNVK